MLKIPIENVDTETSIKMLIVAEWLADAFQKNGNEAEAWLVLVVALTHYNRYKQNRAVNSGKL